jgi:glycosyltransferase involved in cell wall biosynthesis
VSPLPPLPRLAILADFPEEGWPSMDLAAEMLVNHLHGSPLVHATRVCAPFKRRLGGLFGKRGQNFDRLINRMWGYPKYLRKRVGEFDLFHVCDHSYSQLVHELPPARTGVFCHDLDTFRCLLEPHKDPRPRWFRAMARRVLAGMQKAAVVFHLTRTIREEIQRFGLVDPKNLVWAPPAAAEEFSRHGDTETRRKAIEIAASERFLLHVGSCIPRKRIDVLLDVLARVRRDGLKLVQVGGEWSPQQRDQIARLGLKGDVVQVRGLPRETVAALYRAATVVLQPSEAEGFGLPVVEALACGAYVIASDNPVLRYEAGDAAVYRPVGDVDQWAEAVTGHLGGRISTPSLEARLAQARKFSWEQHAQTIARAYRNLWDGRNA